MKFIVTKMHDANMNFYRVDFRFEDREFGLVYGRVGDYPTHKIAKMAIADADEDALRRAALRIERQRAQWREEDRIAESQRWAI
jgi:hypothetical protein